MYNLNTQLTQRLKITTPKNTPRMTFCDVGGGGGGRREREREREREGERERKGERERER